MKIIPSKAPAKDTTLLFFLIILFMTGKNKKPKKLAPNT